MQDKLNYTVILTAVIIVAGLLTALMLFKSQPETVQATGNAQLTVQPDESVVYILVETKAETAEEAKNNNADISAKVMEEITALGLKTVETENYNIYQEYDWIDGKQVEKGFVASNTIKATTKDFTNVGPIIDKAVDAGAIINNINFELSNEKENEYKAIVLAEASKDARVKAEATVSGLGKKIGDITAVSTSDYNYQPYPLFARGMDSAVSMEKVAETAISPSNLDIYATVTVTFEIK